MSDPIERQEAIELIKNYCENGCDIAEDNWCPSCQQEQFIKLLKALPSAQPEQRWIPCSERLPEDEYVLISKKSTMLSGSKWCVTIAIRMADPRSRKVKWMDIGFGKIPDDKVLAWMPLPEPYKAERRTDERSD